MYRMLIAWSVLATGSAVVAQTPKTVDFARDVQPILTAKCVSCHGADQQSGSLRLDRKADAFAGGESGVVIQPGKPGMSTLLARVQATDNTRMPPKGKSLTDIEIQTLKLWIEEGAKWDESVWWSFKPIRKPAIPEIVKPKIELRNPIDRFVHATWDTKKLTPVAETDRRTLIRRLYFDLIGLPPTPLQIEAFLSDKRPDAYERIVDELLASPQYGERWARHWLDVVHYGETHGYDKDKPRPNAWPYRDYVIRSLNNDKPYSRFIQEQVAGDVLFPGTVDGIEALGFLAAGPWDFIGHAEVPESKIDGKIARHLDRDDYVSNTIGTFMGLSAQCAQCHNHKFDPITSEDYYRLQAVFAAIDRVDHQYDTDPNITAQRVALAKRRQTLKDQLDELRTKAWKKADPELVKIEKELQATGKPGTAKRPAEHGYHSTIAKSDDVVKWVQIDLGTSVTVASVNLHPCYDDFNRIGAGFGFPVRFRVEISDDPAFKMNVKPIEDETKHDVKNPGIQAFRISDVNKTGRYVRITATKLSPRQNDYIFALSEVELLDADGKNIASGKTVTALDSIEAPIRWRKANLTDGLYPSDGGLKIDVNKLRERQRLLIRESLGDEAKKYDGIEQQITEVDASLAKLPRSMNSAYIGKVHNGTGTFAGTAGKPRTISILPRGDVTKPGKEVVPGGIVSIPGIDGNFKLPANHSEGDRRAALAKWLSDTNNPLVWRVMANRIWLYHMGRGIVDSPNDFGKMGQAPTHPELLDFLASEFRDHQSFKKLHKLIVTSTTYRLASSTNDDNAKSDGDNHYYWRQNRRKLEAEAVRDAILFSAGKLDLKMGGPSFQDFVIEKPEHSPHYQYHLHNPEDTKSHRRAIYRFVVRSKQQPFLAALDCADPSISVDKRNQSTTPQQALAMMNNKLAMAMAQHFAERVEKAGKDDTERLTSAFQIALGRNPTTTERDVLLPHVKQHGWANTCRLILNLNEFVFVD